MFSALDRNKPLTLLEPDPEALLRDAVGPAGRRPADAQDASTTPDAKSYALADGKDTLEVRLTARDASGVEVVKRYTLQARQATRSTSHYEVKNASRQADRAATAYYQFLRDGNPPSQEAAQTNAFAGVTTFTGPGALHGASRSS